MAIARSRGALFAHAIPVNKHRMRAAIQALRPSNVMIRPHTQSSTSETTVAAAGVPTFIHVDISTPAHRTIDGCRSTNARCTPTAPTSRRRFRSACKAPVCLYSAACGCGWAWGRSCGAHALYTIDPPARQCTGLAFVPVFDSLTTGTETRGQVAQLIVTAGDAEQATRLFDRHGLVHGALCTRTGKFLQAKFFLTAGKIFARIVARLVAG